MCISVQYCKQWLPVYCTAGGQAMNSKSPQKSPPKKHAKTSNKVFPGRAQAYLEETDAETDQSVKNSPGWVSL